MKEKGKKSLYVVPALGLIMIITAFFLPDKAKTTFFIVGGALLLFGVVAIVRSVSKPKERFEGVQYKPKKLMSEPERTLYDYLNGLLSKKYVVLPQVALLSIIDKVTATSYRNELFRVVDFVVFDKNYVPLCVIELNDNSHKRSDRAERDDKVKTILQRASLPVAFIPIEMLSDENALRKTILKML